jgi:hypothetical protein
MKIKLTTLITVFRIVKQVFIALRSNRNNDEAWLNEDRADRELVSFTQKVMRETLADGRKKGRSGWWRNEHCSVEHLEDLLNKAVKDGDMMSVINYAAMIQIRRITDE